MMIGYDSADYWEDTPDIARENYSLWRLMIDENYQKKGFGREAVALGLDFIKSFPCGRSEYCWLSYEPENEVARQLVLLKYILQRKLRKSKIANEIDKC